MNIIFKMKKKLHTGGCKMFINNMIYTLSTMYMQRLLRIITVVQDQEVIEVKKLSKLYPDKLRIDKPHPI